MTTQTDVCNIACALLGVNAINAITDTSVQAITFNSIWTSQRDSELRKHIWKFSILRAQIAASTTTPLNGSYSFSYPLPALCIRMLQAGDQALDFPGVDLSDYRSGPTQNDYLVEGRAILSNLPSPLSVRYVAPVNDPQLWDPCFADAMGARLAQRGCFRITNSLNLLQAVTKEYTLAIREAIRTNALENPSTYFGDDSWISTRPIGSGGAPTARFG